MLSIMYADGEINQQFIATIKKSTVFYACTHEDVVLLSKTFVEKSYLPKEMIFDKGDKPDGLYIIQSGKVSISTSSSEGQEIIFNLFSPGDVFGEIALFDQLERSAKVEAIGKLEVYFISSSRFGSIEKQLSPYFWKSIVNYLCMLLRSKSNYIENFHFAEAPERVATKIIELEKTKSNRDIDISQEKLAQTLGLTREMVNRILVNFENEKIIQLRRAGLKILDYKMLVERSKRTS